jgi:hypothetical protein
VNSESLSMENAVPLGHPTLTAKENSQVETATDTEHPHRHMTDEHRRKLSASVKKMWAIRGGLSAEHRQKISVSVKERWTALGSMPDDQRRKIALSNKNTWARKRALDVL